MSVSKSVCDFLSYFNPFDTSFQASKEFQSLSRLQKVGTVFAAVVGALFFGVGAVAAFRFCIKRFAPDSAKKVEVVALPKLKPEVASEKKPATIKEEPKPVALSNQPAVTAPPTPPVEVPIDADSPFDSMDVEDGVDYIEYGRKYAPEDDYTLFDVDSVPLQGGEKSISASTKEDITNLQAHLAELGETMGKAIDNGDCFFDAMAQVLQKSGIDPAASTKSLRQQVSRYIETHANDPNTVWIRKWTEGHDLYSGLDYGQYRELVGKVVEELEVENLEIRKANKPIMVEVNELLLQINKLRQTIRELLEENLLNEDDQFQATEKRILNLEKQIERLEEQKEKKLEKRQPEKFPVWGSEMRDGKILCDIYQVNLKTYLTEGGVRSTIYPKDAHYPVTVKIGLYPGHFVPVF